MVLLWSTIQFPKKSSTYQLQLGLYLFQLEQQCVKPESIIKIIINQILKNTKNVPHFQNH